MPIVPPQPDELADLDNSGQPVSSRIGSPDNALAIANRLIRDDMQRASRRVKVQGMIDGNAPHSTKALRNASRGGDSNLNWREAKGHVLNAWTPYFDLTVEVPVCVDGDLEYADAETDSTFLRGCCQFFHDTVFKWQAFDWQEQLRDWQMLVHGVGTMVFEDTLDWRIKTHLAGDVYVADETNSDLSNCEIVMITSSMTAGDLWRKIENEKWATAIGWDAQVVKNTIMHSARSDSFMLAWEWDRWQQAFKNGDIYISQTQTKRIRLATIYCKEMDGTISQSIIQYGSKTDGNQFLFKSKKHNIFKDWDNCVIPFPFDIGSDGTWHSVKGLGTEVYPYCELSNRIKNTTADLVLTGIKPMFQPTTGTSAEKFQMVKLGGYNILPPNLNAVQLKIADSIEPALELSRDMQSTLMQNTGTYRQNVDSGRVERTAKEVTINALDQAKLSKGAHNRFYRCKDRQYAEMWRRMANPNLKAYHPGAKEALEFQRKCYALAEKLGFKEEALQKITNIRATRSIGLGSASMRIEIANALMQPQFFNNVGQVEQNNILRAYASNLLSYASVDAYVPSLDVGEIPVEDDSIAAGEDNALSIIKGEAEVVISPKQNDIIHLNHHVGSMEKDVQALQNGADMMDIADRLEFKGAHAHQHLTRLQGNPMKKQDFMAFSKRLGVLSGIHDQLSQQIQEQQGAQPPQGQPDPALVKVNKNAALKADKQNKDLVLKQDKQNKELAMKQQRQNVELGLKANAHVVDNRLADVETAAEIQRKNAAAEPAAV